METGARQGSAGGCVFAVFEAVGQEAGELAGDGPVDAVPDGAPRGGFGTVPKGWLTTVKGRKPAYAMYNIRALARGAPP
ncbi:MAG: hypothetical protein OXU32_00690, partial [Gammaproteobacteria bacterium]|nr:hypothetical protein [Gammaproteobacteria bacterium]